MIDFACGVGYGTRILADAGHPAHGWDIDAEAIAYADTHYRHPGGRTDFSVGDGNAPPGSFGEYEAAICFETIEHLADPRPLLKALRRSAPLLLASVPNEEVFPWQGYAFHYRHYTQAEFEELLAECGWQVAEWWGQMGPESEVERNCNGRTLIAVAERGPALQRTSKPTPAHVAILGLGPSVSQYLELVKRAGGRSKLFDEVWTINALGDVFGCDRIFHMDDVRIQEIRARARPDSNIAAMLGWLKKHPGPIITSRDHPDYPGLVEYPLQDVINSTGFAYFNSTAAYAIAYAIHLKVRRLAIFGMDFTYAHSHHAEKGRACVEFWLGLAAARGIKFGIPNQSSLMDACCSQDERFYGYDTVKVHVTRQDDGRVSLQFSARETLPTAEEIEARYDHTRHVSPLIDKENT